MTGDRIKPGKDRTEIATDEEYDVSSFASRYQLSIDEARELIAKHGGDPESLDLAARKLKQDQA